MTSTTSFESIAQQLVDAGRFIDSKGWVPATSGNFSARMPDGRIAITVSGRHKGRLSVEDIMIIDDDGVSVDGRRPSAETLLHTSIYKRYASVHSVLHPHSPGATVISRLRTETVFLENYELLKAFPGIHSHESKVTIPIFPNDQDIPRLARTVNDWIDQNGDIYGYIIESHGLYTWGDSVSSALRHIEALEFLFEIEMRLHGASK